MRIRGYLFFLVIAFTYFPDTSSAADGVPYTIQSIRSKSSGYVELIGPGKIEVNGEVLPYEGTKFIRISSIGTLSGVEGTAKGCHLSYSSEGYVEGISVIQQSCDEVLRVIAKANDS